MASGEAAEGAPSQDLPNDEFADAKLIGITVENNYWRPEGSTDSVPPIDIDDVFRVAMHKVASGLPLPADVAAGIEAIYHVMHERNLPEEFDRLVQDDIENAVTATEKRPVSMAADHVVQMPGRGDGDEDSIEGSSDWQAPTALGGRVHDRDVIGGCQAAGQGGVSAGWPAASSEPEISCDAGRGVEATAVRENLPERRPGTAHGNPHPVFPPRPTGTCEPLGCMETKDVDADQGAVDGSPPGPNVKTGPKKCVRPVVSALDSSKLLAEEEAQAVMTSKPQSFRNIATHETPSSSNAARDATEATILDGLQKSLQGFKNVEQRVDDTVFAGKEEINFDGDNVSEERRAPPPQNSAQFIPGSQDNLEISNMDLVKSDDKKQHADQATNTGGSSRCSDDISRASMEPIVLGASPISSEDEFMPKKKKKKKKKKKIKKSQQQRRRDQKVRAAALQAKIDFFRQRRARLCSLPRMGSQARRELSSPRSRDFSPSHGSRRHPYINVPRNARPFHLKDPFLPRRDSISAKSSRENTIYIPGTFRSRSPIRHSSPDRRSHVLRHKHRVLDWPRSSIDDVAHGPHARPGRPGRFSFPDTPSRNQSRFSSSAVAPSRSAQLHAHGAGYQSVVHPPGGVIPQRSASLAHGPERFRNPVHAAASYPTNAATTVPPPTYGFVGGPYTGSPLFTSLQGSMGRNPLQGSAHSSQAVSDSSLGTPSSHSTAASFSPHVRVVMKATQARKDRSEEETLQTITREAHEWAVKQSAKFSDTPQSASVLSTACSVPEVERSTETVPLSGATPTVAGEATQSVLSSKGFVEKVTVPGLWDTAGGTGRYGSITATDGSLLTGRAVPEPCLRGTGAPAVVLGASPLENSATTVADAGQIMAFLDGTTITSTALMQTMLVRTKSPASCQIVRDVTAPDCLQSNPRRPRRWDCLVMQTAGGTRRAHPEAKVISARATPQPNQPHGDENKVQNAATPRECADSAVTTCRNPSLQVTPIFSSQPQRVTTGPSNNETTMPSAKTVVSTVIAGTAGTRIWYENPTRSPAAPLSFTASAQTEGTAHEPTDLASTGLAQRAKQSISCSDALISDTARNRERMKPAQEKERTLSTESASRFKGHVTDLPNKTQRAAARATKDNWSSAVSSTAQLKERLSSFLQNQDNQIGSGRTSEEQKGTEARTSLTTSHYDSVGSSAPTVVPIPQDMQEDALYRQSASQMHKPLMSTTPHLPLSVSRSELAGVTLMEKPKSSSHLPVQWEACKTENVKTSAELTLRQTGLVWQNSGEERASLFDMFSMKTHASSSSGLTSPAFTEFTSIPRSSSLKSPASRQLSLISDLSASQNPTTQQSISTKDPLRPGKGSADEGKLRKSFSDGLRGVTKGDPRPVSPPAVPAISHGMLKGSLVLTAVPNIAYSVSNGLLPSTIPLPDCLPRVFPIPMALPSGSTGKVSAPVSAPDRGESLVSSRDPRLRKRNVQSTSAGDLTNAVPVMEIAKACPPLDDRFRNRSTAASSRSQALLGNAKCTEATNGSGKQLNSGTKQPESKTVVPKQKSAPAFLAVKTGKKEMFSVSSRPDQTQLKREPKTVSTSKRPKPTAKGTLHSASATTRSADSSFDTTNALCSSSRVRMDEPVKMAETSQLQYAPRGSGEAVKTKAPCAAADSAKMSRVSSQNSTPAPAEVNDSTSTGGSSVAPQALQGKPPAGEGEDLETARKALLQNISHLVSTLLSTHKPAQEQKNRSDLDPRPQQTKHCKRDTSIAQIPHKENEADISKDQPEETVDVDREIDDIVRMRRKPGSSRGTNASTRDVSRVSDTYDGLDSALISDINEAASTDTDSQAVSNVQRCTQSFIRETNTSPSLGISGRSDTDDRRADGLDQPGIEKRMNDVPSDVDQVLKEQSSFTDREEFSKDAETTSLAETSQAPEEPTNYERGGNAQTEAKWTTKTEDSSTLAEQRPEPPVLRATHDQSIQTSDPDDPEDVVQEESTSCLKDRPASPCRLPVSTKQQKVKQSSETQTSPVNPKASLEARKGSSRPQRPCSVQTVDSTKELVERVDKPTGSRYKGKVVRTDCNVQTDSKGAQETDATKTATFPDSTMPSDGESANLPELGTQRSRKCSGTNSQDPTRSRSSSSSRTSEKAIASPRDSVWDFSDDSSCEDVLQGPSFGRKGLGVGGNPLESETRPRRCAMRDVPHPRDVAGYPPGRGYCSAAHWTATDDFMAEEEEERVSRSNFRSLQMHRACRVISNPAPGYQRWSPSGLPTLRMDQETHFDDRPLHEHWERTAFSERRRPSFDRNYLHTGFTDPTRQGFQHDVRGLSPDPTAYCHDSDRERWSHMFVEYDGSPRRRRSLERDGASDGSFSYARRSFTSSHTRESAEDFAPAESQAFLVTPSGKIVKMSSTYIKQVLMKDGYLDESVRRRLVDQDSAFEKPIKPERKRIPLFKTSANVAAAAKIKKKWFRELYFPTRTWPESKRSTLQPRKTRTPQTATEKQQKKTKAPPAQPETRLNSRSSRSADRSRPQTPTCRQTRSPESSKGQRPTKGRSSAFKKGAVAMTVPKGKRSRSRSLSRDRKRPGVEPPLQSKTKAASHQRWEQEWASRASRIKAEIAKLVTANKIEKANLTTTSKGKQAKLANTRKPEKVKLLTTCKPEKAELLTKSKPETFNLLTTRKPEKSKLLTTGKPEKANLLTTCKSEKAEPLTSTKLEKAKLVTKSKPELTNMVTTKKAEKSKLVTATMPEKTKPVITHRAEKAKPQDRRQDHRDEISQPNDQRKSNQDGMFKSYLGPRTGEKTPRDSRHRTSRLPPVLATKAVKSKSPLFTSKRKRSSSSSSSSSSFNKSPVYSISNRGSATNISSRGVWTRSPSPRRRLSSVSSSRSRRSSHSRTTRYLSKRRRSPSTSSPRKSLRRSSSRGSSSRRSSSRRSSSTRSSSTRSSSRRSSSRRSSSRRSSSKSSPRRKYSRKLSHRRSPSRGSSSRGSSSRGSSSRGSSSRSSSSSDTETESSFHSDLSPKRRVTRTRPPLRPCPSQLTAVSKAATTSEALSNFAVKYSSPKSRIDRTEREVSKKATQLAAACGVIRKESALTIGSHLASEETPKQVKGSTKQPPPPSTTDQRRANLQAAVGDHSVGDQSKWQGKDGRWNKELDSSRAVALTKPEASAAAAAKKPTRYVDLFCEDTESSDGDCYINDFRNLCSSSKRQFEANATSSKATKKRPAEDDTNSDNSSSKDPPKTQAIFTKFHQNVFQSTLPPATMPKLFQSQGKDGPDGVFKRCLPTPLEEVVEAKRPKMVPIQIIFKRHPSSFRSATKPDSAASKTFLDKSKTEAASSSSGGRKETASTSQSTPKNVSPDKMFMPRRLQSKVVPVNKLAK